jgi:hypothetical protein
LFSFIALDLNTKAFLGGFLFGDIDSDRGLDPGLSLGLDRGLDFETTRAQDFLASVILSLSFEREERKTNTKKKEVYVYMYFNYFSGSCFILFSQGILFYFRLRVLHPLG